MVMDTATDAVIIGNPNSGRAGDEGYLERFAKILRSGDLRVEVLNTEHPNHATELASPAPGTVWSWPLGATARSTKS